MESVASQIIVSGSQTVSSSTTNQYVIESGGVLTDKNGGNISATQVQSGGTLVVNSGTEAGAVVSSGGIETISAGSASSDSISGTVNLFGGAASAEQVYSGGDLLISGGNIASNTVLEGGGMVELATSGATLSGSLTFAGGSNTLKFDKFTSAKTVSAVTLSGFSSTDEIVFAGGYAPPTLSYVTGGNGATSVTISTTTGATAVTETLIFAGGGALNALDVISSSNAIAIVSGQG